MGEFITKEKFLEIRETFPDKKPVDVARFLAGRGHEIEGVNAEFSPVDTLSNIPGSLKEMAKNIFNVVKNPKQTVKSVATLTKGALSEFLPEEVVNVVSSTPQLSFLNLARDVSSDNAKKVFEGTAKDFGQRFGVIKTDDGVRFSKDALLNTIEKDPVGFLADAASAVSGTGLAVRGVGTVSRFAGASKAAKFLDDAGIAVSKAGRLLEPTNAATELLKQSADFTRRFNKVSGAGDFFTRKAAEFGEKAINVSAAKAAQLAQKTFKKPPGEVLARFGIHGTPKEMADQLEALARNSRQLKVQQLKQVEGTFKNNNVQIALQKLSDGLSDVQGEKLVKTRNKIQEFLARHNDDGLSLSEIDEVRALLDKLDSPFNKTANIAGIGTVDFAKAGIAAQDLKDVGNGIRKLISSEASKAGFPDISELNKRIVFGTDLGADLRKTEFSLKGKKSLGDSLIFLLGIGGSIAASSPEFIFTALGITLGRRVVQSPAFRSAMAVKLMKLTDNELTTMTKQLKIGKLSNQNKLKLRKIVREVQKIFPEAQLIGKTTQGQSDEVR